MISSQRIFRRVLAHTIFYCFDPIVNLTNDKMAQGLHLANM